MRSNTSLLKHALCALVAASSFASAGCYKASFATSEAAAKREPNHEIWTDHFVFGLAGHETVDTREYCPAGVAAVKTGGNAGTTGVTIATLGIYSPRKVYITCAKSHEIAQGRVLP